MVDQAEASTARAAVFDPSTPSSTLAAIAARHPGWRGLIREHPNADAALRAWLDQAGPPTADEVAAAQTAAPRPVTYVRRFAPPSGPPAYLADEDEVPPSRPRGVIIAVVALILALIAAGVAWKLLWPARDIAPWSLVLGDQSDEIFTAVAIAPDGSIAVVGSTTSLGGVFPLAYPGGEPDAVLARFTAEGVMVWSQVLGGTGSDLLTGVAFTPDGGIVAVGQTDSTEGDLVCGLGLTCGVLAKLSAGGTVEWITTTAKNTTVSALAVDAEGTILAVGTASRDEGDSDAVLIAFSGDGAVAWTKYYGGEGSDSFTGLAIADDGQIVVVGTTDSWNGDFPMPQTAPDDLVWQGSGVIARLAPDGALLWARTFAATEPAGLTAVTLLDDGDILACGYTWSIREFETDGVIYMAYMTASVLVKLSPAGQTLWTRTPDGADDNLNAVAAAADGTIITAGLSVVPLESPPTQDGPCNQVAVSAYSPDGVRLWSRSLGTPEGYAWASGLALARDGDIVIVGSAYDSTGTDFPPSHGGADALLARLNPDGTP